MEIYKIFYRTGKKKFKKYSNEQLIMETLHTLLTDMNELKQHNEFFHHKDGTTQALEDELRERIKDK